MEGIRVRSNIHWDIRAGFSRVFVQGHPRTFGILDKHQKPEYGSSMVRYLGRARPVNAFLGGKLSFTLENG